MVMMTWAAFGNLRRCPGSVEADIERSICPGGCAWTATSNAGWLRITNGAGGTGNGVVSFAVDPNNTGPRFGTIHVDVTPPTGYVSEANFQISQTDELNAVRFDYDADGRGSVSPAATENRRYILRGTAGCMIMEFGVAGDLMVPADYDGEGKTDVAMFRLLDGSIF